VPGAEFIGFPKEQSQLPVVSCQEWRLKKTWLCLKVIVKGFDNLL